MNPKYVQIDLESSNNRKIDFTEQGLSFTRKKLDSGYSYTYTAKELDIHPGTLRCLCKQYGIDRDNRRKYTINANCFNSIDTPEQAYWLGFLMADGYISVTRGIVTITVQRRDRELLQNFLRFVGSNKNIKDIVAIVNDKKYLQSKILVNCRTIVGNLDKYGCGQNKSLILEPPTFLAQSLIPFWVLGYMDGDGCVATWTDSYKTECPRIRISFTGTYNVLHFIKQYFHTGGTIRKEHRCQHTYSFCVTETATCSFLNLVYSNEHIASICLQRKKQKYLQYQRDVRKRKDSK